MGVEKRGWSRGGGLGGRVYRFFEIVLECYVKCKKLSIVPEEEGRPSKV